MPIVLGIGKGWGTAVTILHAKYGMWSCIFSYYNIKMQMGEAVRLFICTSKSCFGQSIFMLKGWSLGIMSTAVCEFSKQNKNISARNYLTQF